MTRRWLPAAAAAAILLCGARTASAQIFIPFGLGNPVFGYGFGGGAFARGGYGFYPGGFTGGYYPGGYGAFTTTGYGFSPAGTAYSGWSSNPYYNGQAAAMGLMSPRYGYNPQPAMSYVAYSTPSRTVPVSFTVPDQPASIEVLVPADAELWFDGHKTSQTGTTRYFTTPSLEKGHGYHYDLRARWTQDGKAVERTRRVNVYAGGRVVVDMTAQK